jgi:hypothetical protein
MPIMTLDPAHGSASPGSPLYRFSGARIDQLDATEYTLVTVVVDLSGSVGRFRDGIVACLGEVAAACRRSPRAANLMLRVTAFQSQISEVHGFLPVASIGPDRYDSLTTGGCTALFDAAANAIGATARYGADLSRSCIDVNALVIVITDGFDNASTLGVGAVKAALGDAVSGESLESVQSILVGVAIDDARTAAALQQLQADADLDLFVRLEDADAGSLARLAAFVSRSVSAQSVALGTGAAGPVLQF